MLCMCGGLGHAWSTRRWYHSAGGHRPSELRASPTGTYIGACTGCHGVYAETVVCREPFKVAADCVVQCGRSVWIREVSLGL